MNEFETLLVFQLKLRNHTLTIAFTKGQLVWLYWPKPLLRQQKRKLTQLWFGPYRIVEFKSEVVVKIQHIKTDKVQVVHVDRLMPCSSVPDISSPHSSGTVSYTHLTLPTILRV